MLQGKKPILDGDQVVRELRLSPRETAPVFGESSAFEKSPSLRRAPSSAEVMAEHLKRVTGQVAVRTEAVAGHAPASSCSQSKTSGRPQAATASEVAEEPISCRVACQSWAGQRNGQKKPNQDAYCFMRSLDRRCLLFGVFDGHGPNGHQVAKYVKSELPLSLMSGGKLLVNAGESFRESFLAVDKMLEDQVDCSVSGTTVVMAQIYGRQLTVAWLGDSRAVLGRTDPSGDCIAVELTQDHKPDLPAEKQRILDNFGRVDRLMDNYGVAIGPPRVWLKNAQVLGLAMSRSMGDTLAHTVGVTTEAEIMKYELSSEDRFVILASDGVWEWVSNSDAVSIVASSPTTEAGCKKLMMTARSRWLGTDRGSYVDDITCMVIGFTHKRSNSLEMADEGA
eukprot:SM000142S00530  [mRNA]  locus=s142:178431:180933:- [translate_table: standard]